MQKFGLPVIAHATRSAARLHITRPIVATAVTTKINILLMSTTSAPVHGDLNNTEALRTTTKTFPPDPAYAGRTLAIPASDDDPTIRQRYRPFLLPDEIARTDWIAGLELSTALKLAEADLARHGGSRDGRLKVLVLYGSLRQRSYSRLLAYEQARILFRLGCDVRVYDPTGLPVKDDVQHEHPKVQELRELSRWSDGHVWVSPEQHGVLVSLSGPPCMPPSLSLPLSFVRSNVTNRIKLGVSRLIVRPILTVCIIV